MPETQPKTLSGSQPENLPEALPEALPVSTPAAASRSRFGRGGGGPGRPGLHRRLRGAGPLAAGTAGFGGRCRQRGRHPGRGRGPVLALGVTLMPAQRRRRAATAAPACATSCSMLPLTTAHGGSWAQEQWLPGA